MKTLGVIFSVAMICLAFLALIPSRDSNRLSPFSRTGSQIEEVVYMSDIDGLVKAVMLYGVTNGITFQGTNYVFVVEDVGPATPVTKRETTFHFNGSPDETYLIEGTLDQAKMIELGFYDEMEMLWIKQPTSVEIGSGVKNINSPFNLCFSLTSATIPNSMTSIDNYAFQGCQRLASITIPDSVTIIGTGAFTGCYFTSLEFLNSVTIIGERAFENCRQLTNITIPSSVTNIGQYAFNGCRRLTSVVIPSSVTSIGTGAFANCNSLTSVTMSGKTKATVQGMDNYPWSLSSCTIHCTDEDITIK